jgi:hypothetical protein
VTHNHRDILFMLANFQLGEEDADISWSFSNFLKACSEAMLVSSQAVLVVLIIIIIIITIITITIIIISTITITCASPSSSSSLSQVSSEAVLRSHLVELIDHKLVPIISSMFSAVCCLIFSL